MSLNNLPYTDIAIPSSLDGIIGQEHVTKKLKGFLKSGNMPHCIFTGRGGLGKSSTKEAFLSEYFKDLSPTEKERNLLVLEASTQKDRGIATINEYRKFCDVPAIGVPFKICVCEEADGFTLQAQKAFKELLSNSVYTKNVRTIFLTNYLNKLLPEIQQRAEIMNFRKVPEDKLTVWTIRSIVPTFLKMKVIQNADKEILFNNKAEKIIEIVKASDGVPRIVLRKLQTFVQSGVISTTDEEYSINPFSMLTYALGGSLTKAVKISETLIYNDGVNVYSLLNDLRKIVMKQDIAGLRTIYKGQLLQYIESLQADIFHGVSDEQILSALIGKCVELGYLNKEDDENK